MSHRRFAAVLAALAIAGGCVHVDPSTDEVVRGFVLTEGGTPIVGATVRIQATDQAVRTDPDGRFELDATEIVRLTAWAPGYYIAGGDDHLPGTEATFALRPVPATDNADYEWLTVMADGTEEDQGCAACHSRTGSDVPFALPVDQWSSDAHGASARNARFLTMYFGTDTDGRQSPPTRFVTNRDYGRVPVAPDPTMPYYGPGYVLDFPDTSGNCATCHVPVAATKVPYGVDQRNLVGVETEGITCDFCHKVWDVALDPETTMPLPNRPGVLSLDFLRPADGHQLFAGPFDDVAPGEDTYSPLQTTSAYCSACHFAVFWDTVVYDSYGEWLRSPYSDPTAGQTCQDCHMPATGATVFATPEAGGLERDPETIRSHLMPGASDEELLSNTVTVSASTLREDSNVVVEVTITNDGAGHHVPTDSPLRHMILLVAATDSAGTPLAQVDGPVLPDWVGVGDPDTGHYAGLPGSAYAKVLEELWTGVSPTAAYWNPTRVVSDNRIAALESDTTQYEFAAPAVGPTTIGIKLLFRRAYIDLMEQKNWAVPDIEMERLTIAVEG